MVANLSRKKTLVELAREWTNAKKDILTNQRSPGDERQFMINGDKSIAQKFVTCLNVRSEEAYRWFGNTYAEVNDMVLDYKLYRDGVMNGITDPASHLRRWSLVYPGAFDGLWEVTDTDTLDSLEEVLINILSGVLRTRRIITV
jgi:hypothetical protein